MKLTDIPRRAGVMRVTLVCAPEYLGALEKYARELEESGNTETVKVVSDNIADGTEDSTEGSTAGITSDSIARSTAGSIDTRRAARAAKDSGSLFIGVVAPINRLPEGINADGLLAAAPAYLLMPDGEIYRMLPSGTEPLPEGTSVRDVVRRETEQRIDTLIGANRGRREDKRVRQEDETMPGGRTPAQKRAESISGVVLLIGFAGFFPFADLLGRLPCGRDPLYMLLYFCAWLLISMGVCKALGGKV